MYTIFFCPLVFLCAFRDCHIVMSSNNASFDGLQESTMPPSTPMWLHAWRQPSPPGGQESTLVPTYFQCQQSWWCTYYNHYCSGELAQTDIGTFVSGGTFFEVSLFLCVENQGFNPKITNKDLQETIKNVNLCNDVLKNAKMTFLKSFFMYVCQKM